MRLNISRLARAARRKAAFTMIEIAISLGVIGFALVAIIGILPIGLNVQKDNREVTLINFDANYLMNAIRSGARGPDELTNYIVTLTNYVTLLNASGQIVVPTFPNWYTTTSSFASPNSSFLTNGSNIIGLLSTPKYVPANSGKPNSVFFFSNYVTADFRAISGSLVDQGVSKGSRDFAFTYRVFPQIVPASSSPYAFSNYSVPNFSVLATGVADPNGLNSTNSVLGKDLQNNLSEIRLLFRFPVLPNGQTGLGHEVFRSAASGLTTNYPNTGGFGTLYYIQPLFYGYAPTQ
jgi:type II secretory pathway pseudopilin PulG